MAKKVRANNFLDQLLIKCEEHNGPLTSVEELKALIIQKFPELKCCLRLEIQYQRETHKRDAEIRKDLYKVNKASLDGMIENLTVILGADNDIKDAVVFPCEDEIMGILAGGITNDCNIDQEANPTSPGEVFYTPRHINLWLCSGI